MDIKKQAVIQALGVSLYCTLVGLFIWNANTILGPGDKFFAPILVLLIFSTSALVCSLIVFYKPYKLFFDGKKKDAVNLVLYTAVSLFVLLILFLASIFIFK